MERDGFMMTNDQAAALALYDVAEEIDRYALGQKRGSGVRRAADLLAARVYEQARRRHFGEFYDPDVHATGDDLRRELGILRGTDSKATVVDDD